MTCTGILLQQPWSGNDATADSELLMKRVLECSLHLLGESGRGKRPERRFYSSGKKQLLWSGEQEQLPSQRHPGCPGPWTLHPDSEMEIRGGCAQIHGHTCMHTHTHSRIFPLYFKKLRLTFNCIVWLLYLFYIYFSAFCILFCIKIPQHATLFQCFQILLKSHLFEVKDKYCVILLTCGIQKIRHTSEYINNKIEADTQSEETNSI